MDYITKIERKMTKKNNYRKGQSFLEYSLIIAATVGVLIIMQHYMSRSLQGKLKESVDSLGGQGGCAQRSTASSQAKRHFSNASLLGSLIQSSAAMSVL